MTAEQALSDLTEISSQVEAAARCPGEYEKMANSWAKLLGEWRKN